MHLATPGHKHSQAHTHTHVHVQGPSLGVMLAEAYIGADGWFEACGVKW